MLETARELCQKAVTIFEGCDLGFIGSTEQTTKRPLIIEMRKSGSIS
jgi:hypothetical protein